MGIVLYLKGALNISGGRKNYVIDWSGSNVKLFVKMQMWTSTQFFIPQICHIMCFYNWTENWDLKITMSLTFPQWKLVPCCHCENEPWFSKVGCGRGFHCIACSQGSHCSVHHWIRVVSVAPFLERGRRFYFGLVVGKDILELKMLFDHRSRLDGLFSKCVVFLKNK